MKFTFLEKIEADIEVEKTTSLLKRVKKLLAKLKIPVSGGTVVPFKKKQEYKVDQELSNAFLKDNSWLTIGELDKIEEEIGRVEALLDVCDDNFDQDVISNLHDYLSKIVKRIEKSIEATKRLKIQR